MVSPRNVQPLILPIGHYLGAQFAADASEPDFHVVRIGWDLYQLRGDDQLGVWALAHGLPEAGRDGIAPWTRSAIASAAAVSDISEATTAIAELMQQDLLIEITPGTPEALDFAQVCRTRSLLVGLGNTIDAPSHFGIGAAERQPPVVEVPALAYELWKWGHACDSLWHACLLLAAAGDPSEPDETDPEWMLHQCLSAIQLLLASGAIYLDEAREDVPEEQLAG